jgi:hypothetical protein
MKNSRDTQGRLKIEKIGGNGNKKNGRAETANGTKNFSCQSQNKKVSVMQGHAVNYS